MRIEYELEVSKPEKPPRPRQPWLMRQFTASQDFKITPRLVFIVLVPIPLVFGLFFYMFPTGLLLVDRLTEALIIAGWALGFGVFSICLLWLVATYERVFSEYVSPVLDRIYLPVVMRFALGMSRLDVSLNAVLVADPVKTVDLLRIGIAVSAGAKRALIRWDKVCRIQVVGKMVVVSMDRSTRPFYVPRAAFATRQEEDAFVEALATMSGVEVARLEAGDAD